MNNLTKQNTLNDFIEKYLQRGFGSMNKKGYKKNVRELLKKCSIS